ncbi:MAG: endonuclease domain-containing protein [Rhodospirillales bacterium]|nr:endonuclease domain-containing protein [Rhodospirillales bacterium]MCB9980727.1 endonuclease domain-containing protein [Rhodospirillales bacterium]
MGERDAGAQHLRGEGAKHTPLLTQRVRSMRSEMTDAESKLWQKLRGDQLGVRFRRQHVIGHFIVDFACPSKKLIIELDGGQHNEPEGLDYDQKRTNFLESKKYKVLRFWNTEIFENLDGVVEAIWRAVNE